MRTGIEFAEALDLILSKVKPKHKVLLPLLESVGRVISEDIFSPTDIPPFRSAAMDGFALFSIDTQLASESKPVILNLGPDVFPGDLPGPAIAPGTAIPVNTGAPVPPEADAVVMKEDVKIDDNGKRIIIKKPAEPGENIREAGDDVHAGQLVIRRGTQITPPVVAMLSAFGLSHVSVYEIPKVAVISTGNELIPPGTLLTSGRIYDSNRPALISAIASLGIKPYFTSWVPDDADAIKGEIEKAGDADVFVITGGISAGKRDMSAAVFREMGVEGVFHGVKQKPGKPLYYGIRGTSHFFGLPGNPVASFLCFYVYIYPLLMAMSGRFPPFLKKVEASLLSKVSERGDRMNLVSGKLSARGSEILFSPSSERIWSHKISLILESNGVALIDGPAMPGDKVEVLVLPWAA